MESEKQNDEVNATTKGFKQDKEEIELEDTKFVIKKEEQNLEYEPQVSWPYKEEEAREEVLNLSNQRIDSQQSRLEGHRSGTIYSCLHCDFKCTRAAMLHRHKKTHFQDRDYYIQCLLSPASYLQRAGLHHPGPFACTKCQYTCTQPSYLKQHMRIHTGDRPFACDHCPYRCSQRGNLKQHLRIHTGEKPYSCSQCDYRCKQRSHLQQHERIHTGHQPYQCNQCEYKFTQLCHLKQHMRAAHKADQTL